MENKVAAVVVTYNRKDLLLENIESLLKQTVADKLTVVIIDNASTDGTRDSIQAYIDNKQIIYINTGENLGGAGGFQYGIRYATEHQFEYIWVMDDDCIPTENALEEFLNCDRKLNGQYGFLSSKVLWKDNNICKMNIQRKTLTKYVTDFDEKLSTVAMASFVSLFMPTKVVLKVGLPIKEFFIWTDDWEYTRRISQNYSCYLLTTSVVIHKSANNIGANIATDGVDRLDRYRYLYRNDVYLYRRESVKGFIYEVIRLSGHVARVLIKSKNNRLKRIKMIFQGTKEGFKFMPDIEYINE